MIKNEEDDKYNLKLILLGTNLIYTIYLRNGRIKYLAKHMGTTTIFGNRL